MDYDNYEYPPDGQEYAVADNSICDYDGMFGPPWYEEDERMQAALAEQEELERIGEWERIEAMAEENEREKRAAADHLFGWLYPDAKEPACLASGDPK